MPRRDMFRRPLVLVWLAAMAALFLAPPAEVSAQERGGRPDMVDVLIGFQETPGAREEQLVRGHGGTVRRSFTLVPAIAASLPEPAIQALQNDRRVTVVEPDGQFHIIEEAVEPDASAIAAELANTWGVEHIGAGLVHAGHEETLPANLGTGIGLAVLDTGLDYTHPEFHWNYAGGHNFHADTADPLDDHGHGTHVSGSAAAARDGAGVVGVAPDVHLYALKTLSATGGGSFNSVIAALQWCVNHNADLGEGQVPILVTNHSYGSAQHPGSIVEAAFNNAYDTGILHVAAAGNSGNPGGKNDTVNYPAAFASVIAVAATNQNNTRPSWSSTGPAVELSAPGVSIYSSVPGGGYGMASGTSMASPHVAGLAALVWSSFDTQNALNDATEGEEGEDAEAVVASEPQVPAILTNDEVRSILALSAIDLGNTNRYGFGLVDAPAAVQLALSTSGSEDPEDPPTDPEDPSDPSDPEDPEEPTDPGSGVLRVASIDYALHRNGRHLDVLVFVIDDEGALAGATVVIEVLHEGTPLEILSGTTDSHGTVAFRLTNAPSGSYSAVVIDASKEGWEWDGETPDNSF